MPSNHLILCHPLLLLPPIPPSIRVFSSARAPRSQDSGTPAIPATPSQPPRVPPVRPAPTGKAGAHSRLPPKAGGCGTPRGEGPRRGSLGPPGTVEPLGEGPRDRQGLWNPARRDSGPQAAPGAHRGPAPGPVAIITYICPTIRVPLLPHQHHCQPSWSGSGPGPHHICWLLPSCLQSHGIFQARVLEWGAIAFSVKRLDGIIDSMAKKPAYSFIVSLWGCDCPLPALAACHRHFSRV